MNFRAVEAGSKFAFSSSKVPWLIQQLVATAHAVIMVVVK